jgi:hypothetical protein
VDSQTHLAPDHDDDLGNVDVRALFWRNNRLVLLDNSLDSVLSIDPVSHVRERLANNSFPAVKQRAVYGYDSVVVNGTPYFDDAEREQLLALEQNNTVRVAAGATITGSAAFRARDLVTGSSANLLYALDYAADNSGVYPIIRTINTGTGATSTLMTGVLPGNAQEVPQSLAVSGNNGYLVSNTGIYAVNMTSGTRTLLSAPGAWNLASVRQLAVDSTRNRLLLASSSLDHLIAVDLTTGAQTAFSPATASGTVLAAPWGVAVSPTGEIWVSDASRGLFRVDATSGARTLMSGPGQPDNENQPAGGSVGYKSLQFDGENLYAIDTQGEVVQVDTRSGHRATLFSGWRFPRNRAPSGGFTS